MEQTLEPKCRSAGANHFQSSFDPSASSATRLFLTFPRSLRCIIFVTNTSSMSSVRPNRAPGRRARVACSRCSSRKVRCNVVSAGPPCANCIADEANCEVLPRKKRSYEELFQAQPRETNLSTYLDLDTRLQAQKSVPIQINLRIILSHLSKTKAMQLSHHRRPERKSRYLRHFPHLQFFDLVTGAALDSTRERMLTRLLPR